MKSALSIFHSLLGKTALYQLAMTMIGGSRPRAVHVGKYIRPRKGDRILDVGCGPADILDSLPDVSYLGVDMNPNYINSAQNTYRDRGTFICADVTKIEVNQFEPFDIILATGLLHHLCDQDAVGLLDACSKLLKPQGRMITFDGCRTARQNPIDRWLLDHDRGQFVRTEDAYKSLALQAFQNVKINLHSDLLRIPYTLAIMELSTSIHTVNEPLSNAVRASEK